MRDPYRTARMTARLLPLVLLLCSNVFMIRRYGHLKYRSSPLWLAIGQLGHRLFEYSLMVPAHRWAPRELGVQLKTIREILTLLVFAGFSAGIWVAAEMEPLRRVRTDHQRGVFDVQG